MAKFEKGLFTDCSETDQPDGTYRFAKNIIDSNIRGVKENEDGFISFGEITPYTIIGVITVGQDWVVFSTDNTNSEIGKVTRTTGLLTYTTVYNDPLLNFNTGFPIDGEFRKDVDGQRIVAWTDNRNTPRILNIDNLTGINDIQDLNVFQDIQNPSILSSSINDTGGSLTTGALIVFTRYRNKDGSETNIFVHDHVFYINDDPKSEAFNLNDGASPGTTSNKSITVTLQNCDTHYDTIIVGYLQSINGIITAKTALTLTNATTVTFTLTGSESSTDTSLEEVLTESANYNTAKAITQLSGGLVLGNLTADDLPDLQLNALDIIINYTTSLIDATSNTGSHKDNLPPSLMPGEVYAFYLGVELNKGGWAFYHIPGRPIFTGNELDTILSGNLDYVRYQVDNTTNSGAASNLGYWQNMNEVYPNYPIYGSLIGTPVRHHRMPTTDYLVNTTYSSDGNVGIVTLPRIGIVASNVNIPPAIQAKIKRWKIFFAKKNENTALVMGSDLAMFTTGQDGTTTTKWSSAGNWEVDARGTSDEADFKPFLNSSMRGHSLDMLYNNTSIIPSYARFNYQLKRQNLNQTYTGFRSSGARLTISGQGDGTCSSAVIDYTVPSSTTRTSAGFIKSFDSFTFLPPNSTNNGFKSLYNEGSFIMDVHNPSTSFNTIIPIRLSTRSTFVSGVFNQFSTYLTGAPDPNIGEDTMYMQYFRLLTDVHVSFLQQDLIPLEGYASPTTTSQTFYGGDTFLCYMSFLTLAPLTASPNTDLGQPSIEGIRIWRGYIGYSRNNWNYRFQETGQIGTFYHGKTDVRNLFSPTGADATDGRSYTSLIDANQTHNILEYDPSYSTQNIFSVGTIFDPTKVHETRFPNTVIWSNLQPTDTKEFSWRTFPSGNRYVIPKGKGDIVNLQGWHNKDLIIHTEHSFFKTRTDIRIAADGENVFFKSVNLFDLPPEELIPTTTGYGGTQNRFGCVLTKVGYIFPSDLQGKIFLFNGDSLEEISTNGLRIFFRDFMGIRSSNDDNPFNSNGYTIGYDERANRLLITKTFGGLSWTISYNPIEKYWTSYHDYIPDYMFTTVDGTLYSIKDNKFYAHNTLTESTQKGVYYGPTPVSSLIDIVHNDNQNEDKIFTGLEWVTEVYPNTYTSGQPSTVLDYTNTVTHLTLRSQQHCTGRIPVSLFSNFDDLYTNNIRNLNRTWYFNEIRDIALQTGFTLGFYNNFDLDLTKLDTNMSWYDQRKFIDKFVICRYEYDNQINNRFLFLESKANYRHADR